LPRPHPPDSTPFPYTTLFRSWLDRIVAAVPLLSVFLWLCMLYAWEVRNHPSPWLFSDELEFSQLSRSIAETGHAARRGEPHYFRSEEHTSELQSRFDIVCRLL